MNLRRLLILISCIVAVSAVAQRRITPVDPNKKATPETTPEVVIDSITKRPASVIETTDISGKTVLIDTISGVEYRDTILTEAPKLVYPRWESVAVGVNIWDPLMRIFGQKYGLIGFWGELSIHNWIKPIVEIGLGKADYIPDDERYHYKSGMAPYFKLGVNYNFLYNSNPDYSVFLGVRYGLSSFNFQVDDVVVEHPYWREQEHITVPSQHSTVGYFEFLVGLRVMLFKNFYAGWSVGVHTIAHESKLTYGNPWYIPGYGTRGALFTGAISLNYTLPLPQKKKKAAEPEMSDEILAQ